MTRLGVVGGHLFLDAEWPMPMRAREIACRRGAVTVLDAGDYVVLQRHGFGDYVPPHRIDHQQNMEALVLVGCDRVLACASVGALRNDLPVGSWVLPDDFIALDQPVTSAFDDRRSHIVPRFDTQWRRRVVDAISASGVTASVGGTYWQSNGPRFETPAEVRLQATFADVVGMTVGSECVAACELGLSYTCISVVDNLANGVGDKPLTIEEFDAGVAANRRHLMRLIVEIAPELAR